MRNFKLVHGLKQILIACLCVHGVHRSAIAAAVASAKPNIVMILADDLGRGELGCYGQDKIKTPHVDQLAAEGMKFSNFYSGSTVCAPSRCTLMTGKHTGHAYIRDNYAMPKGTEGQFPIPTGLRTVGNLLQDAGYTTACIGKWGLGGPGSTGEPNQHGFDYFFGHLCQGVAHNHYTDHLWRNTARVDLAGNTVGNVVGKQFAPDLMADEAVQFIRQHAVAAREGKPFFLYFCTPLTHVSLQVPEDSMKPYLRKWEEKQFKGDKSDYTPQEKCRAAYAGMVSRMDDHVGRIMDSLKQANLDENTLVLFSSDNGPTFNAGTDSKFFVSAGPFRGLKEDLYEGGIRAPLIARWTGKISPGTTSNFIGALWDMLPTFAELARSQSPKDIDGVSMVPTLLARGDQPQHEYLYWEYHSKGGTQAVRMGKWKAVRTKVNGHLQDAPIELYDLAMDIGEKRNVAAEQPAIVEKMKQIMLGAREESSVDKFRF